MVKKLKAVLLRSGRIQAFSLPPLLFNIVLEGLATAIRPKKKRKTKRKRKKKKQKASIQIRKEEVKMLLVADNVILYIGKKKENLIVATKKTIRPNK